MFKKNEIKKALHTICKSEAISKSILSGKTDAEQSDAAFIKGYSAKMYSDELYEFLNDEAISELKCIEFGDTADLGVLGECVSHINASFNLNAEMYGSSNRIERVCKIGTASKSDSEEPTVTDEPDKFIVQLNETTYITENGNVLTVKEITYMKGNKALVTVRIPDDAIAPSFNLISGLLSAEDAETEEVSD